MSLDEDRVAHAYPRDLALLVRERWAELHRSRADEIPESGPASRLPDPGTLERLFSICYQASLLHEEGRPVTFRVALAEPECFSATEGPPTGLHRLALVRSRPFDEHELRRLAPAATFQRALIGVAVEADDELRIWGLIHSGPRWLQAVRGGRRMQQSVPSVLMAAVTGPGRVLASRGKTTLAALANGTLADAATDVFLAPWLAAFFSDLRPDPSVGDAWTTLDPAFGPKLAEHVLRRIVATVRGARHGGTLVLVPAERAGDLVHDGRYLAVKYPFVDDEPRRRIYTLTVQIRDALARLHVRGSLVGWAEYEASNDPRLAALDEALFEVAHLVAMLAAVDGAVVLTDRLEILGFGAEISGALAEVDSVDRSLDLEGTRRHRQRTERVGTRHRSAYRLCQNRHDALVVVVSQDGGVRFVRWQEGRVTFFDQIATGPWEV